MPPDANNWVVDGVVLFLGLAIMLAIGLMLQRWKPFWNHVYLFINRVLNKFDRGKTAEQLWDADLKRIAKRARDFDTFVQGFKSHFSSFQSPTLTERLNSSKKYRERKEYIWGSLRREGGLPYKIEDLTMDIKEYMAQEHERVAQCFTLERLKHERPFDNDLFIDRADERYVRL